MDLNMRTVPSEHNFTCEGLSPCAPARHTILCQEQHPWALRTAALSSLRSQPKHSLLREAISSYTPALYLVSLQNFSCCGLCTPIRLFFSGKPLGNECVG